MSRPPSPRAIRPDEPGFSPRILAEIAANNPASCRLSRGRLRASPLHVHLLRHGLSGALALASDDPPEAVRQDAQAVRELIRMFEG